jgi:hypothetical protein
VLHLMNKIVYIAEYLLNGALITMRLHTTLSSSGIQEQISPTGKCHTGTTLNGKVHQEGVQQYISCGY